MPDDNKTRLVFEVFKMAKRLDDGSGETLLAPCARRKKLQRKMTTYYFWIGAQENIVVLSEMIIIALISCHCLKYQLAYVQ